VVAFTKKVDRLLLFTVTTDCDTNLLPNTESRAPPPLQRSPKEKSRTPAERDSPTD
jgi:hypothetical protein